MKETLLSALLILGLAIYLKVTDVQEEKQATYEQIMESVESMQGDIDTTLRMLRDLRMRLDSASYSREILN